MRATASSSRAQQRLRAQSSFNPVLAIGLAGMALGAALFSLGLFHGFAHGSCSTTGYSAHYGPVPHCAGGTGWWMLMLVGGIFVAIGGAALAGIAATMLAPVIFIAVGAPFIALALRSSSAQLAYGVSTSTGKLEVGIFGACFAIAGVIWAVFAGRRVAPSLRGSRFTGLLASLAGVGVAFAIATAVSGAIGTTAPTPAQPVHVNVAPNRQARAAAARTSAAIVQANKQLRSATKLAACVTAAGTNTARIEACEAKYVP